MLTFSISKYMRIFVDGDRLVGILSLRGMQDRRFEIRPATPIYTDMGSIDANSFERAKFDLVKLAADFFNNNVQAR